jgi:hypothetical protein
MQFAISRGASPPVGSLATSTGHFMRRLSTSLSRVALFAVAAAAMTSTARAQNVQQAGKPAAKSERWRLSPALTTETEYDNNIYLLSPTKVGDVATPSASQITSGRYAGMKSASDVITTAQGALVIKGPGMGGRPLQITPALTYEFYAVNAERRNTTLQLSLAQELPRGSRAQVSARMTPSYFWRNYLADAVDANADGSIASAERLYQPGVYRETELAADYRLRLRKATKHSPVGAKVQLSAGYYGRAYDAPFAVRDLSGPTAGATVLLDLTQRVGLDLGYDFGSFSASPGREIMLLDEPLFGRDFNGNGTTTDLNARANELADHSRRDHNLGSTLHLELPHRATLAVAYAYRLRQYTSTQPYDVANNGRRTSRNELGVEFGARVTQSVRLIAAVETSSQSLNRTSDVLGSLDAADYSRQRAKVRLSYQF